MSGPNAACRKHDTMREKLPLAQGLSTTWQNPRGPRRANSRCPRTCRRPCQRGSRGPSSSCTLPATSAEEGSRAGPHPTAFSRAMRSRRRFAPRLRSSTSTSPGRPDPSRVHSALEPRGSPARSRPRQPRAQAPQPRTPGRWL
eukprot:1884294-Rhodomonas_salina.3